MKILIIDDNIELIKQIQKELYNKKLEKIKGFPSIKDALNNINVSDYDILLLDLIMPNESGYYLLDYIKKKNINIKTIIISSFITDSLVYRLSKYNIADIISKPFNLNMLSSIIYEKNKVTKKISSKELLITKKLNYLGIPYKVKGYSYLKDAILSKEKTAKKIYEGLSKKYNTSCINIERNIRNAIEISFNSKKTEEIYNYFGNKIDSSKGKLTNLEFILAVKQDININRNNI